MDVFDSLTDLLGGGSEGFRRSAGAGILDYLKDVVSGKVASEGVLAQNHYDPNRSFAQNALDPAAIEQATDAAFGVGPGAIRAWHASPFDFNKFDLSKIGTGQGAQSYGHGIYAAESPAVSGKGGQYDLEFTAKNLGKYDLNPGELQIHRMLRADRSDMDILGELARGGGYTFDEAVAALARVKAAKAKIYEVDIHADPKAFLDWDKPLYRQPSGVQEALGWTPKLQAEYAVTEKGLDDALLGALRDNVDPSVVDVFSRRANDLTRQVGIRRDATGGEIYEHSKLVPGGYRDPPAASSALKDLGIPGIRYLDQGSRGAGGGTSNYSIFDPSIIQILRKYGILPPMAAGGLLATEAEP